MSNKRGKEEKRWKRRRNTNKEGRGKVPRTRWAYRVSPTDMRRTAERVMNWERTDRRHTEGQSESSGFVTVTRLQSLWMLRVKKKFIEDELRIENLTFLMILFFFFLNFSFF